MDFEDVGSTTIPRRIKRERLNVHSEIPGEGYSGIQGMLVDAGLALHSASPLLLSLCGYTLGRVWGGRRLTAATQTLDDAKDYLLESLVEVSAAATS